LFHLTSLLPRFDRCVSNGGPFENQAIGEWAVISDPASAYRRPAQIRQPQVATISNSLTRQCETGRQRLTTDGHIGQHASLPYFLARYLDADAHLRDGSFEDWSHPAELPVERSGQVKNTVKL
jgi:hypothetical protein